MATTKDSSGGVELGPFYEQEPFLKREKKYYGYVSGVGAGKTFAGILRTALNMEEWNPGEMGAIVAPTRTMIQDVIISEMRELGFLDHWEFKSSYAEEPGLHSPNGSRALILSADNKKTIERLRGLNLAWFWMDEEAIIDQRAREILMQRLRTGEYRNGYVTTTPKGRNHTYDFFVGDRDTTEFEHGEGTIYEDDDRLAITGVPSWANPHTPEDYHESMAADMPDEIRAQEVEGNFVDVGAGVFKRDMFTFVDPGDINGDWRMQTIIGVDPAATAEEQAAEDNDSDYWGVCVVHAHSRTNSIFVTDTEQRRGMTLSEGVEWVQRIARNASSPQVVVESNQAQRWLQQALTDAGVNAIPVQSSRNKEQKLVDLSIPLENDTVQFVDWNGKSPVGSDHPYQELVGELLAFPEGSHDDLADALYLCVDHAPVSWGTSIIGGDAYGRDEE